MAFVDKAACMLRVQEGARVALELGCGSSKRNAHALGVDMLDAEGVDLVGDVFEILAAFPDASVEAVFAYHFFEHVENLAGLLAELARVLVPKGQMEIDVPHFSNPYFYSDPTHHLFFGLYTFSYFVEDPLFRRKVPRYGHVPAFVLKDATLGFHSPFFERRHIKRAIGWLFNRSRYLQELYEENFSAFFPCYELRFKLERL